MKPNTMNCDTPEALRFFASARERPIEGEWMRKAADEIERLRAEVAVLKQSAAKLHDIAASGAKPLMLYVWHGFGLSYSPGIAFAIARTKREAKGIVRQRVGEEPTKWGKCRVHRIEEGRCEINYGGA